MKKENLKFKIVMAGYEKAAVDKYIENCDESLQRVLTDSEIKIKQAKMVANIANNEAEEAKSNVESLTASLNELTSKFQETDSLAKEYFEQNVMLKSEVVSAVEEYKKTAAMYESLKTESKAVYEKTNRDHEQTISGLKENYALEREELEMKHNIAMSAIKEKHYKEIAAMNALCKEASVMMNEAENEKLKYEDKNKKLDAFAGGLQKIGEDLQVLLKSIDGQDS